MAFIDFTAKNVIHIPEVDAQHERLFEMLNSLHAATVEGQEQTALVDILNALIDYTVEHFQTEEDIMLANDYPAYEAHKQEHDALTGQAVQLLQEFRDGSATISFELLDFLHDWLNDHTMGTDMELGTFMNRA